MSNPMTWSSAGERCALSLTSRRPPWRTISGCSLCPPVTSRNPFVCSFVRSFGDRSFVFLLARHRYSDHNRLKELNDDSDVVENSDKVRVVRDEFDEMLAPKDSETRLP